MRVSLKDGFEYIPEWNGNKKLPKDEQIVVNMHFQTGLDLTESINLDGTINKEKDWLSICESIKNLEVDGKPAEPIDICSRGGLAGLYLELKSAYRAETAIDKKK